MAVREYTRALIERTVDSSRKAFCLGCGRMLASLDLRPDYSAVDFIGFRFPALQISRKRPTPTSQATPRGGSTHNKAHKLNRTPEEGAVNSMAQKPKRTSIYKGASGASLSSLLRITSEAFMSADVNGDKVLSFEGCFDSRRVLIQMGTGGLRLGGARALALALTRALRL